MLTQLFVLSLVGACVDSARITGTSLGHSEFVCPSECVECCDSSAFFGLFGRSFKCVLRDKTKLPASRECKKTSRRSNYISSQYKTHCKYNDDEGDAPDKCSHLHTCCCASNGNWHEAQCLDGVGDDGIVQAMANHTGKMETFRMRSKQVFVNQGACRRQGNQHHPYDSIDVPRSSGQPRRKSRRATGCCLETRTHTVKHTWTTESLQSYDPPSYSIQNHYQDEDYTICARHEELHFCSDDNGLTSNGKFVYDSVSQIEEGMCIGDEQPTDGKMLSETGRCPKGTFTGDWCKCQGNCGNAKGVGKLW